MPLSQALTHGPLIPDAGSDFHRFQLALVLLAGGPFSLVLFGADYARWARSKRDILVLAVSGSVMMEIVVVTIGAILVFGSAGLVGSYLVENGQATAETAAAAAQALAKENTGAYFIVLSSMAGFLLMYAAQAKAQVLNNYTGALSVTNFFDVVAPNLKISRAAHIVLISGLSLVFVALDVVKHIHTYANIFSAFLAGFCAVLIADYFIVGSRGRQTEPGVENVNWAGVLTVTGSVAIGLTLAYTGVFASSFITVFFATTILYPLTRLFVIRKGTWTSIVPIETAYQVREELAS